MGQLQASYLLNAASPAEATGSYYGIEALDFWYFLNFEQHFSFVIVIFIFTAATGVFL